MSLITVVDRSGVRWTKFNCVHTLLTGSAKNSTREVQRISSEHVCEYQHLDLPEDQRVHLEQSKTKYVDDAGLLEYSNCCAGQRETIDGIIKELNLTVDTNDKMSGIVVYRDTLVFNEEDVHIEDTFCMLNLFGKVWIEAVKLCKFFDYANPWKTLKDHIVEENKETLSNLMKIRGDSGGEEFVRSLSDLSRDLLFINEAGLWQLSQHSRKPMLKRFWANMCKTLSERYNMVFDVQQDEVFAVPKPSTSTGEPMDVDGQNYKVLVLEAQLRASEAENKTLALVAEKAALETRMAIETAALEKQLTHAQSLYLYNVDHGKKVNSMFLNTLVDVAVNRENADLVRETLRGGAYQVAQSISDVNPQKENIVAFVWYRWRQTYSIVRQIRESFDNQYKYVQADSESAPVHRKTGREPKRHNEGGQVLIGCEFLSYNGQSDWTRFKNEHPHMMFGVEFVNHALVEFKILTKPQLQDKYELYLQYTTTGYDADADLALTVAERIIIKYNMGIFSKIKVCDVHECLKMCLVPNIWYMHANLATQMHRDHLAEIEAAALRQTANRHELLKSEMNETIARHRSEFERRINLELPPSMVEQLVDAEAVRAAIRDCVRALHQTPETTARGDFSNTTSNLELQALPDRMPGFFYDLHNKRQNKP